MTYDQFIIKAKSLAPANTWDNEARFGIFRDKKTKKVVNDYGFVQKYEEIECAEFFIEWLYKDVSGGSCWESSNPQPSYYSEVPKFKLLDSFLAEVTPNLSFLNYKYIENNLIHENERHESEYYGNSSDFRNLTVDLKELYEFLKSKNCWG